MKRPKGALTLARMTGSGVTLKRRDSFFFFFKREPLDVVRG